MRLTAIFIDASNQVSVHLAKWFQRRRFFQKSTNQKQELPVAAIFVNGLKLNLQSLYRTFQVSVHLAKQFQRRRFFRNRPIRNNNCLWWPCLFTDRDEMSNIHRGPSIIASYQVSVHLAKRFQRRRLKCEKLTNNRLQVMAKAHFAFGKVS